MAFGLSPVPDVLRVAAGSGTGTFVINARTDTYFHGGADDAFAETIERATRYVEAGADCIFVPGVDDANTIRRLAIEIPAPPLGRNRIGRHTPRAAPPAPGDRQ